MKPHFFHPAANEEYARAVQYYSDIRPELGRRLYDEVEWVIRKVRSEPDRFFQFSPPARRALVHNFPYSVVYLNEVDRLWIVAIMHAKRHPNYWRDRL